jgi:uncharacterized protein YjbI with pentapeptide repeats
VPIDDDDLTALLPELDPAPGPALIGGASYDGLRFAGLELTGDATGAHFLECELADCGLDADGDAVGFDRARLSTCRLAGLRATALSVVDVTWLDVVVAGGRIGALTAHGAGLTRVAFEGVTLDYLDLRGATLADVTVRDCRIRELDLTGAGLRDVRFETTTVASLVLAGARSRQVDLRGAEIGGLDGVAALAGCTISAAQLTAWSEALAVHLGISVA